MMPRGIEAICKFFDVALLTTICEDREVHFLGCGRGRLTPLFYSQVALGRFCISISGRAEMNRRAVDVFPNWDGRKMAWKN